MANLQKFYKGKRVLITGHTGFKGSWLVQTLLSWGTDVSGLALRPHTAPNLFNALKIKNRMRNHFVDVRKFKKVRTVFAKEKPEIVFHLAAQPIVRDSYDDPLYTIETNTLGTTNVLEAIRNTPSIRSAVMITTDKVYEDLNTLRPYKEGDRLGGHDPYSSSKASAELLIASYIKSFFHPDRYKKTHHTLIGSARAGNIIGGGDWSKDRIIPDLVSAVFEHGKPLVIRSPRATRPWQYVLQPLFGYLMLARALYEGKIEFSGPWNFGPERKNHIEVRKLLRKAFAILGRGSFDIHAENVKHEAVLLSLDSTKARNALGWSNSFSIDDSIRWTIDWYKNFYVGGNQIQFTERQIKLFSKICNAEHVNSK